MSGSRRKKPRLVKKGSSASGRSIAPIVLLIGVVLAGMALRIYFFDPGIARSPDEGTYTRQANVLLARGMAGIQELTRELAANPAIVARNPSPARIGYLSVLAGFMRLTDDTSVVAGATLSLLSSFATLSLLAFISYRVLSAPAAVAATVFYSVFPFDLTISRRAWQDSFIALCCFAIFSLAVYLARAKPARHIAAFVVLAILGFLSITIKANAEIFFLLSMGGLTVYFLVKRDRRAAIYTACSATAALVVSAAALSWICGGLARWIAIEREFTYYSGVNPYCLQYDAGPAWMFPAAFFRTSPVVVLAALAGVLSAIYGRVRARSLGRLDLTLGLCLITVSMLLLQVITERYCFRFTAPVYGTICMLAGMGIAAALPLFSRLAAPVGRRAAWAVFGLLLVAAAVRDLNYANEKFIATGFRDLALRQVYGVPPMPLAAEARR